MVRIGLVGCGTIGSRLARALQRHYPTHARITALHDVQRSRALALQRHLHPTPPIVSLPELLRRSRFVVEAASAEAAREIVPRALRAGRDVFVMSVGGLLQDQRWRTLARRAGRKVYVPSGALAGLDGVAAMAVGRIRRMSLTTRKPPKALAGAPGLGRAARRLERLTKPLVVFDGSPAEVVRRFPQNTNVAAALTLSGGDAATRRRVRVVADPTVHRNIHELEVESDCGRIRCRIESRPSANPKTSELAVRSAIATLGRLFEPVVIGT